MPNTKTLSFSLFLPCLLAFLSGFSTSLSAAGLMRPEHSMRQSAMAGAFIAQVADSTALSVNPAGLAPMKNRSERFSEFSASYSELDAIPGRDEPPESQVSVLWGRQGQTLAWGLGGYDSGTLFLDYVHPETAERVQEVVNSLDLAACLAGRPYETLALGATLMLTSTSSDLPNPAQRKGRHEAEKSDSGFNLKLGAQWNVAEGYLDFLSNSTMFGWTLAATYQPEKRQAVFDQKPWHPYVGRKVSTVPESAVIGSHMNTAWLAESFSVVLNLNVDLERFEYSALSDLLMQTPQAQDLRFQRQALGAELLVQPAESKVTLALRAGTSALRADRSEAIDNSLDENIRAMGLGIVWNRMAFDLTYQRIEQPAASDASDNRLAGLSLSLQF